MKIISKFQDYYDIGLAYGVDEKLRFERVTEVVTDKSIYGGAYIRHRYQRDNIQYRATFYYNHIGFCGKIYPFIHIHIEKIIKSQKVFQYTDKENLYIYDIEDFEEKLLLYVVPSEEIILSKTWVGNHFKRKNIVDLVKKFLQSDNQELKKLFSTYKQAYFVREDECIMREGNIFISEKTTLLPQLKQYKFAKVVPPMQAFQEISMYIGEINNVEDNTITIDDKYLAQGKGFDCYSFKKMPSQRKVKDC